MKHDFSCHAMPLERVFASHDAVHILNVTITILRSKQSKLDVTYIDTIGTGMDIILY